MRWAHARSDATPLSARVGPRSPAHSDWGKGRGMREGHIPKPEKIFWQALEPNALCRIDDIGRDQRALRGGLVRIGRDARPYRRLD